MNKKLELKESSSSCQCHIHLKSKSGCIENDLRIRIFRPYALPRDDTEVYDVSDLFFHLLCRPDK